MNRTLNAIFLFMQVTEYKPNVQVISGQFLMYEQLILLRGGIGGCNIQEIIHDLNRTIHKNIGWKYPHKVVKEMIASCHDF